MSKLDEHTIFTIFDSLQNLMKLNQNIDSVFKDLENSDNLRHSLEQIEINSLEIVDICNNIEETLQPKNCCCCSKQFWAYIKNIRDVGNHSL